MEEYLKRPLPTLAFESFSIPTTGQYPSPTWRFEEWDIDKAHLLEEVAIAVAKARGLGQWLRILDDGGSDDAVMSEAGIQNALSGPLRQVSRSLRMTGFPGARWVSTPPVAATMRSNSTTASSSTAAAQQPGPVVKVQGLVGKKPDVELLDEAKCVRSFIEIKVP